MRGLVALTLLSLLPAATVFGHDLQRYEAAEPHMGTLFRIVVYAESREAANRGFLAAFERAAELDQALSDYRPDSELNRLCRQGMNRPTPVSEDLFAVLSASQELAYRTAGAFDVTAGEVTRLWRAARRAGRPPSRADVQTALITGGFRHLYLDANGRYATLTASLQIDLGGIAKGYAADEMLRALRRAGLRRALVAAAGDIRVGAAPPGRTGWRVAAEAFGRTVATLEIVDAAISTSGDTEQFLEHGDLRFSHIVDPRTGLALTSRRSVTVIADTATAADSFATAISVLGVENAWNLAEKARVMVTTLGEHSAESVRLGDW